MAELNNEENSEDHKLQFLINKFDPKLKLSELKNASYKRLVNWIEPIQREIDTFQKLWHEKIDAVKSPFKEEALKDKSFVFSYKNHYANSIALVKCFDEQRHHLNHPMGLAGFTTPHDGERGLYFYSYPFNEYLAYQTAKEMGLQERIPETTLAIIQSGKFSDVLGMMPKEKICSLQRQVADAVDPFEFTVSFFKERQKQGSLVKEILESYHDQIDTQAFEDVFLLSWVIGEMNGSTSKYLLVPRNNKMVFLKGNSLNCFSSNYFETDSFLLAFPNLNKTLSKKNREMLLKFNEASMIESMRFFGKDQGAIACFRDRVRLMKELAKNENTPLRSFSLIGLRKDHWKLQSFLLKLYHEGIAFT